MITLFKKYAPGSNITLLNTIYHRPRKIDEKKWSKGAITLVAKDLDRDTRIVSTIENPKYEYYMTMPYVELEDHTYFFYDKDELQLCECPFKDLDKDVAKRIGKEDFFWDCVTNGRRKDLKLLHTDNRLFRSQMNIEDFYRYKFGQTYKNEPYTLNKGYIDIEVDIINIKGDFPEPGEAPINAVTFIDHGHNSVYTFLLETDRNPLIQKFKEDPDKENRIREEILRSVNGPDKLKKYRLDKLEFKILFYKEEDEIVMLQDLFQIINLSGVDFLMAWNMSFDIPYIIARIQKLGYYPEDIMCHPSFKYKEVYYFIDEENKNKFHKRTDYCKISSPVVYIDQLIHFASRRGEGGISAFANMSLDTVAFDVAGVHKYDYSNYSMNIRRLPYDNYEIFVIYNIVDVIAQVCIEEKSNDIEYIFTKALDTDTRYDKIHRQSVFLTNAANKIFEEYGYICGNNVNKILQSPKVSYPGAYVSNPILLGDYAKKKINGMPVPIMDNNLDFDFARLYPSEEQNFNMAPNTQIGKIEIEDQCFENDDYLHNKLMSISSRKHPFNRGGKYIEDISAQNWMIFGNRWLHLSDMSTLVNEVLYYITHNRRVSSAVYDPSYNVVEKEYDENTINVPYYIKTDNYQSAYQLKKREVKRPYYIRETYPSDIKKAVEDEINGRKNF